MSTQGKRRTKSKRQSAQVIPLHMMPFCEPVKDKNAKSYPMDFWAIKSTGSYFFDYALGKQLGEDFLDYVIGHEDPIGLNNSLQLIVGSMVKQGEDFAAGVRVGFFGCHI